MSAGSSLGPWQKAVLSGLRKTLRSMSEGSSLRSCQRAVLSELRKNATEHV